MTGAAGKTASLEFLGSGTSVGMPMAGCACPACHSPDSRDQRYRSSVLIRHGDKNVVIDTGPEFRLQMLRANVMRLDAVLITHDHADHLNGLDDIRAYCMLLGDVIPVYAKAEVLESIRLRFSYIWNAKQIGGGLPKVVLHDAGGGFAAAGLNFLPVPVKHGVLDILGYRLGDMAYLTDASEIPDSSLPLLGNLKTLVLSCVQNKPHPTHMSLDLAIEQHLRIKPAETILTHLTHRFTHAGLEKDLPPGLRPAYDGMRLEINL